MCILHLLNMNVVFGKGVFIFVDALYIAAVHICHMYLNLSNPNMWRFIQYNAWLYCHTWQEDAIFCKEDAVFFNRNLCAPNLIFFEHLKTLYKWYCPNHNHISHIELCENSIVKFIWKYIYFFYYCHYTE